MSIQLQIRDKSQIVATLHLTDNITETESGLTYVSVDADAVLALAAGITEARTAVMAPAVEGEQQPAPTDAPAMVETATDEQTLA